MQVYSFYISKILKFWSETGDECCANSPQISGSMPGKKLKHTPKNLIENRWR